MEIDGDGDDGADNPLLVIGSSGSAALLAVDQAQLDGVRARYFDGDIASDADLHDALRDIGLPKQDATSASVRIRAARRAERVEIEDQFTKPEYDPSEDTLEDYGEMVVNYGCVSAQRTTNGERRARCCCTTDRALLLIACIFLPPSCSGTLPSLPRRSRWRRSSVSSARLSKRASTPSRFRASTADRSPPRRRMSGTGPK